MRKTITFIMMLCFTLSYGQNQIIETGLNITSFSSKGDNVDLNYSTGSGIHFFASAIEVLYDNLWVGIVFDEFNSHLDAEQINYKTNYLGLNLKYSNTLNSSLNLNTDLSAQKMISGTLNSSDQLKELSANEYFKGLLITPSLGIDYHITQSRAFDTYLGYRFSYSLNPLNKSDITTSYFSHRIGLIIKY